MSVKLSLLPPKILTHVPEPDLGTASNKYVVNVENCSCAFWTISLVRKCLPNIVRQ